MGDDDLLMDDENVWDERDDDLDLRSKLAKLIASKKSGVHDEVVTPNSDDFILADKFGALIELDVHDRSAPGAFGTDPTEVPLKWEGGEVIGRCVVNPDGSVSASIDTSTKFGEWCMKQVVSDKAQATAYSIFDDKKAGPNGG